MFECVNPNYIKWTLHEVKLVTRNEYLQMVIHNSDYLKYYETRCGKCLPCKMIKSYQKANRLMIEGVNREFSYFVTLTFNDENYFEKELLFKPLRQGQLFMKRLRKRFKGVKIKYFLTSELGTLGKRFHYHLIIFSDVGLFEDMFVIGETDNGIPLFSSNVLKDVWGKGRVSVDYATFDNMRYAANYVQDQKQSVHHSFSRGIGDDYLYKYIDGSRALISGNKFNLTRTQLSKLNIEKDSYVIDPDMIVTMEQRKKNLKELKRSFYRK